MVVLEEFVELLKDATFLSLKVLALVVDLITVDLLCEQHDHLHEVEEAEIFGAGIGVRHNDECKDLVYLDYSRQKILQVLQMRQYLEQLVQDSL